MKALHANRRIHPFASLFAIFHLFRTQVEESILQHIHNASVDELLLANCVMYHYGAEEDCDFVTGVHANGTLMISGQGQTNQVPFGEVDIELLLDILSDLEKKHFVTFNEVELELPEGIGPAS